MSPRSILIGALLQAPAIPATSSESTQYWTCIKYRNVHQLTHSSAAVIPSGRTSEHCPHSSQQMRRRTLACRCHCFHSLSSFSRSAGERAIGSSSWWRAKRVRIADSSSSKRLMSWRSSEIRGVAFRLAKAARALFSSAFKVGS